MNVKKTKFAVIADLHLDIMHDGKRRLADFLHSAKEEKVDFIIHLGDLCYPTGTSKSRCPIDKMPINVYLSHVAPQNDDVKEVIEAFNSFDIPSYHVVGNHDFDFASCDDVKAAYGMESTYYSFHVGGWHFIVLDPNYCKMPSGELEHYDYGQYFLTRDIAYISKEQLEWLKEELSKFKGEPAVLFSHQPLYDTHGGIANLSEFGEIITQAKQNGKQILMSFNGHTHIDRLDDIDGILYYHVNCASNMWVGSRAEPQKRFSDEIEEKYPSLKYVIPYTRALFSIVTLDKDGVFVKGRSARYVQPGPRKIGFKESISSKTKTFYREWNR